jgi:lysophospholipase L1-like esterase
MNRTIGQAVASLATASLATASRATASLILASLALGGCQQAPAAKAEKLPAGARYVAMGSSYAAGPGIPTYVDHPPTPCTRSDGNYAHQLAKRLKLNLVDVSCSGGVTRDLLGPKGDIPAQLDALTVDTRLVTITIGGNDLNYLARLTSASCEGLKAQGVAGDCRPAPPMPTREDYGALKVRMAQIAVEVRRRAPQARLVFVDYLTVLPPLGLCPGAPMSSDDAGVIREIARGLAELTAETARAYAADVIRASELSTSHDACSASPWMNGYPRPGAPISGAAYHPNLAGMTAEADALERLLQ